MMWIIVLKCTWNRVKVQYLLIVVSYGILTKIGFICMNYVYLNLKTRFLLISVKRDLNKWIRFSKGEKNDTKRHFEPHHSAFVLGNRSKFCVMLEINDWTHTKIPWIHNVTMDTLEVVVNFKWSIKTWHIPVHCIANLLFRTLQNAFVVNNITREGCIKVTILDCGWRKTISNKPKC